MAYVSGSGTKLIEGSAPQQDMNYASEPSLKFTVRGYHSSLVVEKVYFTLDI